MEEQSAKKVRTWPMDSAIAALGIFLNVWPMNWLIRLFGVLIIAVIIVRWVWNYVPWEQLPLTGSEQIWGKIIASLIALFIFAPFGQIPIKDQWIKYHLKQPEELANKLPLPPDKVTPQEKIVKQPEIKRDPIPKNIQSKLSKEPSEHLRKTSEMKQFLSITSYEIMPYVAGKPPEIHIHIKNHGTSSIPVALQYNPYTVGKMPEEDYEERRNIESKLWSMFERGLDLITTQREFTIIPVNQNVWFSIKGIDPIPKDETEKKRADLIFYFLSRLFDSSGNVIYDSCVFIKADSQFEVHYCIDHN